MTLTIRFACHQDTTQLTALSINTAPEQTPHDVSDIAQKLGSKALAQATWHTLVTRQENVVQGFDLSKGEAVLIAELPDGQIVGAVYLDCKSTEGPIMGRDRGIIHWGAVALEYRNKGYGTELLRHAGEYFHRRGCLDCIIDIHEKSPWASFLAGRGFRAKKESAPTLRFSHTNPISIGDYFPPILITERLLLRSLTINDMLGIFGYAKNPRVARFTLWDAHKSHADTLSFLKQYVFGSYAKRNPDPFGIVIRNQEKTSIVGTVGCFWVSKTNKTMELGYALAEEHWGKGYTTEAAQAVISYVFDSFQIERLVCRCITENEGSRRVMDKLNFRKEGIQRHAVFRHGQFWDLYTSAMLKEEYQHIKADWNQLR